MQRILSEIAGDELNNDNPSVFLGPDCDFAKDINEFQSAKVNFLKKIGENFDLDAEDTRFVCDMMKNLMQKALDAQK